MSVKITSVLVNNDFRTAQDLSFLLACIGEKVKLDVFFEYQDVTYASTVLNEENQLEFNPTNSGLNLANNVGILESEDGSAFTNYFVGDTIKVFDSGLATTVEYTITEKIDFGIIRTNYAGANKILGNDSFVYNNTPFAGLRYAYNLIDSGASFNSLIDGEYQQGESDQLDATDVTVRTLSFTGEKSYQIGSLTVQGVETQGINGTTGGGDDDVKQLFHLIHNTVITPFFLANQYNDLVAGVKPSYFDANNTLNYIAQLSLGRDLTNPNRLQTLSVLSNQSNVGWFNERFNGGVNNYSISSLILTDVAAATVVTQLQFSKEIQIDILVDNTTDSPFSDTNTNYTFGFNYLPESSDLYDKNKDANGNGYDQTRNFAFDSKSNVLGNGSVNGDNFGNDLQIIKTVTSTYISATQMKVTVVIDTGTDADTILQQGNFDRYQFWVITENHVLAAEKSDKVNLLASVNEFFVQQVAENPIISSLGTTFIEHPYTDKLDGVDASALKVFPVDDLVANTDFYIDFDPTPSAVGVKAQWIRQVASFSPAVAMEIIVWTNGTTIGTAEWQGTDILTAEEIRDSINTNTDLGHVFFPNLPFDNSLGWTATVGIPPAPNDIYGNCLILSAPTEGTLYNSFVPNFRAEASNWSNMLRIVDGVDASSSVSPVGVVIKDIKSTLYLGVGAESEFRMPLEEFSFSTANFPLVGLVQNIAFSQDRVFKIPASIRKTISCYRDFSNDTATKKFFTYQYPFMHRWEYWQKLIVSLNNGFIPASLFDNTQPNDGINHFWHRYTTVFLWHIFYEVEFTLEQNGIEFTQKFTNALADSTDFDGNPDWTTNEIKSFDIASGLELISGSEKFIKGYEDVRIEASFNKTTGPVPAVDQVGIVIWIETYEKGGIADIRRISSFYPTGADTWFKSVDATDKVEVTKAGGEFTGKCLVDFTKLPTDKEFTIYARIYEFEGGEAKQFMNDDDFEFMDGTQYNFM